MSKKSARLAIVIPCYNEEESLDQCVDVVSQQLQSLITQDSIADDSFVCLVDDGSSDDTWNIIKRLSKSHSAIRGLKLSKNYGHQKALLSGLMDVYDKSDVVVTMDADLQHDVSLMGQMLQRIRSGAKIVYAVRKKRSTDSFVKNRMSNLFYDLMGWMGVDLIKDHADFRMCTSQVLEELSRHNEAHVFLRGIFPSMGFTHDTIYFDEKERASGETKYSFSKMLGLAINGITSFSVAPLRLIFWTGFTVFLISLCFMMYAVYVWWQGDTTRGWTSTIIVMSFMGGIQLLSIGVIGEYLGRVYNEVKARPRYIIEDRT